MVELPTRFYVQASQTDRFFGPHREWRTLAVTFDRDTAEQYAQSFEKPVLFEQGEDESKLVATVARVVTAEQLRDESEESLALAESVTRIQFWQALEEWAKPLTSR